LRRFLNEEENEWETNFFNVNDSSSTNSGRKYMVIDAEKESWSNPSAEYFSGPGSSDKTMEQSSDKKSFMKELPPQKSRHCRHFLKGHCERGDSCGFRHDRSVFCTNMQKVFLGGLPSHLNASLLRQKLVEQGYTVLNHPKVLRWFSPQVCLGSVDEAKKLIEKGTINIDGTIVRVRPFESYSQNSKKTPPDEVERSVFLGGLTLCTTADIVREEIGKLGLNVVNIPVVKTGYSPQVMLESVEQAQTLLKLKQVVINGAVVNVRPYANIRNTSGRRKTKSST